MKGVADQRTKATTPRQSHPPQRAEPRRGSRRGTGRGAPSLRTLIAIVLLALPILLAPAWAQAGPATDDFSATQVAQGLLNEIGEGLRAYNSRKMLTAFDRDGMQGYLAFRDQVESFFAQYESFRVGIRLMQSSIEQDKGMATAEFRLEGVPRGGGPAMRREQELTFEFIRTANGWKIRDVSPRSFFL